MGYLCYYNYNKSCDACGDCCNSKKIYCPVCDEELGYDDELYFHKYNDEVIGCNHCVYTKYAEDCEDD